MELLINNPNGTCIARFSNGEEVPLVPSQLTLNGSNVDSMIIYDFYVFNFSTKPKTNYSHLTLGNWSNVAEGNLTYTCGYPLDLDQQIISIGIMSTKYNKESSFPYKDASKGIFKIKRNEGWLDLTINNGNSGGAVIKVGKTIDEDKVIGIVDFKLNPFADTTQKLINILQNANKQGSVQIMGVNPNETSLLFAKAVKTMSLGVSGCVSIQYVKNLIAKD